MTEHTPEKVSDLIVEARTFITPEFDCAEHDLIRRLADALEAMENMRAMTLMFMHHARAERDALIDEMHAIDAELDRARANGTVYTYGNIQHRIRMALSRIPEHPKED